MKALLLAELIIVSDSSFILDISLIKLFLFANQKIKKPATKDPKQLINIISRTGIFDLRADLSDQLDGQETKSIDIDEVKTQLVSLGVPYKEINLFTKSYKFILYLVGWSFSFIGWFIVIPATLGYFQLLSYENNSVLSLEMYFFELAFAAACLFIGYISKIMYRNILEIKRLESVLTTIESS